MQFNIMHTHTCNRNNKVLKGIKLGKTKKIIILLIRYYEIGK